MPRVPEWTDQEVVAGTVLGEASSEAWGGEVAVACVIRNRAEHPRWWGRTFRTVCLAPQQFSCWDQQMTRIADNRRAQSVYWRSAMRAAEYVMDWMTDDVTLGCDHYYAHGLMQPPWWARRRSPVIVIGGHTFFRLELEEPYMLDRQQRIGD